MKWMTRSRLRVNRTATAWISRRFVASGTEILFVDPEGVERRVPARSRRASALLRGSHGAGLGGPANREQEGVWLAWQRSGEA